LSQQSSFYWTASMVSTSTLLTDITSDVPLQTSAEISTILSSNAISTASNSITGTFDEYKMHDRYLLISLIHDRSHYDSYAYLQYFMS